MNLPNFRSKLRDYRKQTGYSQQDLAAEVGLHHTVLSAKLNATNEFEVDPPGSQENHSGTGGLGSDQPSSGSLRAFRIDRPQTDQFH